MASLARIDLLVESGLCSKKKLPYARIIMSDVRTGIYNMVYRDLCVNIFSKITDYVLNDQIMYQRLRQLLLQNNRMSNEALDALTIKSDKYKIPLEIVMEVYKRGYDENPPVHLSREQHAFNRVNSYLAGGAARKLDSDLDEMQLSSGKREWGTASLSDTYRADTPGQSGKSLKVIKRIIKDKK